jgi:hypothetical protein
MTVTETEPRVWMRGVKGKNVLVTGVREGRAPARSRILLLERGGYLPREPENWDSREGWKEDRVASVEVKNFGAKPTYQRMR